jgi:thiamine biosynthesis lipoprotein
MVLPASLLLTALACPAPGPGREPWNGHREVRVLMGTAAEVGVRGLSDPHPALDAAFAALQRVDDSMSLWKEGSELSRLNARGAATVSADLSAVLRGALAAASASEGAFDPTVEPLVRAAGGLGGSPRALDRRGRASLLARVGYRRVELDAERSVVRLAPGTRLDLGGIAKGYAADLALAELRQAGASAGYVDLGSSSQGAFGVPLVVELRDPEQPTGETLASFRLADAFLATSAADQRGDHILDPRTGLPARGVLSATVVARTGMQADALSTAVYVLGPEKGLALLERQGAAGFVVWRERGRRVLRATAGFAEARVLVTAPGLAR